MTNWAHLLGVLLHSEDVSIQLSNSMGWVNSPQTEPFWFGWVSWLEWKGWLPKGNYPVVLHNSPPRAHVVMSLWKPWWFFLDTSVVSEDWRGACLLLID